MNGQHSDFIDERSCWVVRDVITDSRALLTASRWIPSESLPLQSLHGSLISTQKHVQSRVDGIESDKKGGLWLHSVHLLISLSAPSVALCDQGKFSPSQPSGLGTFPARLMPVHHVHTSTRLQSREWMEAGTSVRMLAFPVHGSHPATRHPQLWLMPPWSDAARHPSVASALKGKGEDCKGGVGSDGE